MALNITEAQLAAAIRLQDSPTAAVTEPHASILHRLRAVAEAIIVGYAVDTTPADVKDEAAVLMVGYMYDAPPVNRNPTDAFALSGAKALLSRWHEPVYEVVT